MSKRLVVEMLTVFACIFILSVSTALAPCYPPNYNPSCEGNLDYDCDVDGTDASLFKSDFGRSKLINACPPSGPAMVPKTGRFTAQRSCDDGDMQVGVPWPTPRFTDNGFTVTDNLTGLEWFKQLNILSTPMNWEDAMQTCLTMEYDGTGWRLPSINELLSLIDWEYENPAISNTAGTGQWTEGNPFVGLGPIAPNCWSSTILAGWPEHAWGVATWGGYVFAMLRTDTMYVWPVRGGIGGDASCTPITTTSVTTTTTIPITTTSTTTCPCPTTITTTSSVPLCDINVNCTDPDYGCCVDVAYGQCGAPPLHYCVGCIPKSECNGTFKPPFYPNCYISEEYEHLVGPGIYESWNCPSEWW